MWRVRRVTAWTPIWTTRTAGSPLSTRRASAKSRVDEKIEKYSVMRSLLAVERADVRHYDRRDRGRDRAGHRGRGRGA